MTKSFEKIKYHIDITVNFYGDYMNNSSAHALSVSEQNKRLALIGVKELCDENERMKNTINEMIGELESLKAEMGTCGSCRHYLG